MRWLHSYRSFAALCIGFLFLTSVAAAEDARITSQTHGFPLPAFNPTYPSETFYFEGNEAKRLAREILPLSVDQVARASVVTAVGLPDGSYIGLWIDLTFEPRATLRDRLCEEPHAFLDLRYNKELRSKEMRLTLSGGALTDHILEGLSWSGRYRRLSETPASIEAFASACRKLATDTTGWGRALNADEFIYAELRQAKLEGAVRSLPLAAITCLGANGRPCGYTRAQLLATVQAAPPQSSRELYVPEEGAIIVFNHTRPNVQVGDDYDMTMHLDLSGRPRTLHIRFTRNPQPAI